MTVFIPTRATSAPKRLSKRARANACLPVSVYIYPCVLKKQRGTRKSTRAARHSAGRLVCVSWVSLVCDIHHTATHRKTLQYTITLCNTIQCNATHCHTRQHIATHCSTLQHTAAYCNTPQHTATHYNTLQRTMSFCYTLQHNTFATICKYQVRDCNTQQHILSHCNALQHVHTKRDLYAQTYILAA